MSDAVNSDIYIKKKCVTTVLFARFHISRPSLPIIVKTSKRAEASRRICGIRAATQRVRSRGLDMFTYPQEASTVCYIPDYD